MNPKTIFKLSLIGIHRKRRKSKDDYPRFNLEVDWWAFYSTLKQAEDAMPSAIKEFKEQGWYDLHSCRIEELPLGEILTSPCDNYSERIYDSEGVKLDERLFPSYAFMNCFNSTYRGRKPEEIRFKPGDVVEYGDQLCVVDGFMRPYREGEVPHGDSSDDGYLVWMVDESADNITLDEDGFPELAHSHPQATALFTPRYPISEKSQRRINNIRKHFNYGND
ncbi:MAG: hypothetical protein NC248_12115 [Bacteroides sp.]|nr:hypothetical protein [Muribaculum sp.]MCM1333339.1 hypothetical protein [Bacteroides sp.]